MMKTKKVRCNLLQIEVYAQDPSICGDKKTCYNSKDYPCLIEKQTATGVNHILSKKPYEITPAYVKSFAASADYRGDIQAAMNTPAPGANLGDLTGLQEILSKDMAAARAMVAELQTLTQKAAAAVVAPAAASAASPAQTTEKGDNING